ncbi:MAG: metalloregulator ArsR/SmtB family transcription factor [Anaerolineales bacterium]|jgi:ArsR family transcriptional regulator
MQHHLRDEVSRLHAQVCSGLADPNRILILYTLSEHPYSVNELADALDLPQSTTSRHLKVLRERGMVESERSGQMVEYTLADQRIIQALDLLREFMSDWLDAQADLARGVSQALEG